MGPEPTRVVLNWLQSMNNEMAHMARSGTEPGPKTGVPGVTAAAQLLARSPTALAYIGKRATNSGFMSFRR